VLRLRRGVCLFDVWARPWLDQLQVQLLLAPSVLARQAGSGVSCEYPVKSVF
jgi:hypothetical protein